MSEAKTVNIVNRCGDKWHEIFLPLIQHLQFSDILNWEVTLKPFRPAPPVPERRIYEVEVRKPKKGERFFISAKAERPALATYDHSEEGLVVLSERTIPPSAPVKRKVRKLELREARKGERFFFCNESTAKYDSDGPVWVIVEETEEEVRE